METTLIRVGNSEYARENHSYGLTTMRNKHVQVEGSNVTFKFQGKSGVRHTVDIHDRRLAKIIQRCQDIPGYELFQYVDAEGEHHAVDSADVNDYLREMTDQDFTAKDFRTWAGTVLACTMLQEFEAFESQTQAKRNVVQAIKEVVARASGQYPAVCRKCYVHPAVLDSYFSGAMIKTVKQRVEQMAPMPPRAPPGGGRAVTSCISGWRSRQIEAGVTRFPTNLLFRPPLPHRGTLPVLLALQASSSPRRPVPRASRRVILPGSPEGQRPAYAAPGHTSSPYSTLRHCARLGCPRRNLQSSASLARRTPASFISASSPSGSGFLVAKLLPP